MKTYDMKETSHGDTLYAMKGGFFEEMLNFGMIDSEELIVYSFSDGLRLRFRKRTYQRRIDQTIKLYKKTHGEPISLTEEKISKN